MIMSVTESSINYAEHAVDILAAAVALIKDGQRCALVASLSIEGGAAREVGSLAVIAQSGVMTGYLSNGCIDRDIMLQGLDAIETGQVKSIRYGTGSPFIDLVLPCGGALELVIDPEPHLATLQRALDSLMARRIAKLAFSPIEGLLTSEAGPTCFRYYPKVALVLAGRGAILRTTAKLAAQMDFDLHIASPEDSDLDDIAALGPKSIQPMTRSDANLDIPIDQYTAVLLLFHDHDWELNLLMTAAKLRPFFLGAMGSRKTHQIRLERLRENGLATDICETIHGPIGLVPSLRSASQIAISALAEVISKMPR